MEGILTTPFGLYETISQRPNVMIEAGFALAKRKSVILIVRMVNGRPDPEPPSDLGSLIQVRYDRGNKCSLVQKLNESVPTRYLSPYERLRTLLESSTELERTLLAFILENPAQLASRIAGEMESFGYSCSNQELMRFFRAYDEFLEFERPPEGHQSPGFVDLRVPRVIN